MIILQNKEYYQAKESNFTILVFGRINETIQQRKLTNGKRSWSWEERYRSPQHLAGHPLRKQTCSIKGSQRALCFYEPFLS